MELGATIDADGGRSHCHCGEGRIAEEGSAPELNQNG